MKNKTQNNKVQHRKEIRKMEQLRVKNLVKAYGTKGAVNGISYAVHTGEIIGLLGANGAGKSTSIRVITGIEQPTHGQIFYEGDEITNRTDKTKRMSRYQKNIGVVPQEIALYGDMSAYDNVKFFCSLYGYHGSELKNRVEEALKFVGLWEHRREKPSKYSGGMKRRLNIASSIAHSPKLLIMDEPTVGIDPQSRNHIMETIKELNRRGTTVIYVSHYMEEIEQLCNRIILMDEGKIIEDCEKEALKQKYEAAGLHSMEDIFLHITGKELRDGEE